MVERAALLIGVSAYDDARISNLPFVDQDIDGLKSALSAREFTVELHDSAKTDSDRIDDAIEGFFASAEVGQNLLLFLSGHGVHSDGRDYLLPSSANMGSRKVVNRSIEIDFRDYIEASRCGDVLIVVDACREGVQINEKSISVAGWSRQKREKVSNRCVTYVYACSSGEWARYISTEIETYSIFSRAFSQVVLDENSPSRLDDIVSATQLIVDRILADNDLPAQRIKIEGVLNGEYPEIFVSKVGRKTSEGHRWMVSARQHAAWKYCENENLKNATLNRIDGWSKLSKGSVDHDPWWDPSLAVRMSEKVQWLLTRVLNEAKLVHRQGAKPLSEAEIVLLVTFPFAYQSFWMQNIETQRGAMFHDPVASAIASTGNGDFEVFCAGFPRLVRRVDRLESEGGMTTKF